MHRLHENHYVTEDSKIIRPFYVVVSQPFASNTVNVLDLQEGDIFICTMYNKIGHWWGVSVYDLQRQGWFPSTLVQPYAGEVPEEASDFLMKITHKVDQGGVDESDKKEISETPVYNIVSDDAHKYQEYEVSAAMQRVGRNTRLGEQALDDDPTEREDFDYETWAAGRNAGMAAETRKKSRNS
jgi:hypothetical protein